MKYGIIRITTHYPLNGPFATCPEFNRQYVHMPDKTLLLFDSLESATDYAEKMVTAAREENILDVSYRAKPINAI